MSLSDSRFAVAACLLMALLAAPGHTGAQTGKFQIEETTIAEVHVAIQRRELSCVQLIQQYLNRIERHNKTPGAILHVNSAALETARRLDASVAANQKRAYPYAIQPRTTLLWASRPSRVWSAATVLFRYRLHKIASVRTRAASKMQRFCCRRSRYAIPTTPSPQQAGDVCRGMATPGFLQQTVFPAHAWA
jgi:hypothetical protein